MRAQHRRRPSAPPSGPTRRALLAVAGLAAAGATGAVLTGCADVGTGDDPGEDAATAAPGPPAPAGPLIWAGRPGGLDERRGGGPPPSLAAFTRRTGVEARYLPELRSDGDAWAMLGAALGLGRPVSRDVMVLGDEVTARAVAAGWAEPLSAGVRARLADVVPALLASPADPARRFSVPWRSAYTGLVWVDALPGGPPASVDDLARPALRGRVVLPASWSDGLSVLAMAAGRRVDGPAGAVADVLDEALERVERLRRDRQLLPVLDPADALERGRAVAGLARSTDVQRLQAGAPGRFSFVVPDAGALLVTDHLVVPRGAARAADAARLVAHYLEPAVAAAVSGTVPGLCPVAGASDVLAETDAVRAVSPLLFPTDADLARTQVLTPLDPDVAAGYAEAYATLTHP